MRVYMKYRDNVSRQFFYIRFCTIFLMWPVILWAAEGCETAVNTILRFPSTIGSGAHAKIMIAPDLPIGGIISTVIFPASFMCPSKQAGVLSMLLSRFDYDGRDNNYQKIYQTNIDGVGMRVLLRDIQTNAENPLVTAGIGDRFVQSVSSSIGAPLTVTGNFQVDLIKITSNIPSAVLRGNAFQVVFQEPVGQDVLMTQFNFANVRMVTAGCSVKTKNILIPMGCISASLITSKIPEDIYSGVSISLDCTAGTRVFITFSDATNPSNRSDILSLTKDSTAKGIGIRMTDTDNQAIFYGPDSSAIGIPGQRPITASSQGGELMLLLTARYVLMSDKVIPGSADGVATFTLAYQ